jgi:hypothetical protein
VLELKVPHGANLAALWPLLPVFMSYVLSFVRLSTRARSTCAPSEGIVQCSLRIHLRGVRQAQQVIPLEERIAHRRAYPPRS